MLESKHFPTQLPRKLFFVTWALDEVLMVVQDILESKLRYFIIFVSLIAIIKMVNAISKGFLPEIHTKNNTYLLNIETVRSKVMFEI